MVRTSVVIRLSTNNLTQHTNVLTKTVQKITMAKARGNIQIVRGGVQTGGRRSFFKEVASCWEQAGAADQEQTRLEAPQRSPGGEALKEHWLRCDGAQPGNANVLSWAPTVDISVSLSKILVSFPRDHVPNVSVRGVGRIFP